MTNFQFRCLWAAIKLLARLINESRQYPMLQADLDMRFGQILESEYELESR